MSKRLQDMFKTLNGFRYGLANGQSLVYIGCAAVGAVITAKTGGTFEVVHGVRPEEAFVGGFIMLFGSR